MIKAPAQAKVRYKFVRIKRSTTRSIFPSLINLRWQGAEIRKVTAQAKSTHNNFAQERSSATKKQVDAESSN